MALELENIDNLVTDDLDLRNRNWTTIDDSLELKAGKTYVDSQDELKADKSDTYTKTEVDTSLELKADKTDVEGALEELDAVDNTVTTHLAESASKHIKESGSNANGRYVKFDDGTMICYGRISKSLDIDVPFGTLFRNDNDTLIIEYPVQFYIAPPALSVVNSGPATTFFANQAELTTSNAKMYAMRPASITAHLLMDWQAIGRWKA